MPSCEERLLLLNFEECGRLDDDAAAAASVSVTVVGLGGLLLGERYAGGELERDALRTIACNKYHFRMYFIR